MLTAFRIAFLFLIVIVLVPASAKAEDWRGGIDQASLMAQAGNPDSAFAVMARAESLAFNRLSPEDGGVAVVFREEGRPERYYFESYADAESILAGLLDVRESIAGPESPSLLPDLMRLGDLYFRSLEIEDGLAVGRRARDLAEASLGHEDPDLGRALRTFACACVLPALEDSAETAISRSLEILTGALGDEHPDVGLALLVQGMVRMGQRRFDEAEAAFTRSRYIAEANFGARHPETAVRMTYQGIAIAHSRPEEGVGILVDAISILDETLGSRSLEAMAARVGLERAYSELGDADRTLETGLAVTGGLEAYPEPNQDLIADALYFTADAYSDLGQFDSGKQAAERCLDIRKNLFGDDHPKTAWAYFRLGGLENSLDDLAAAEGSYLESLRIMEEHYGTDHVALVYPLGGLGSIVYAHGRYHEAELYSRRTLELREAAYGPESAEAASGKIGLANCMILQWKLDEAVAILKEVLPVYTAEYGEDSPRVALVLLNLGHALLRADPDEPVEEVNAELEEAAVCVEHARGIYEDSYGPEHYMVSACLGTLGDIYTYLERYNEAEDVIKRAMAIRRSVYGEDAPEAIQMLETLCSLKRYEGKYEEAIDIAADAVERRHSSFSRNAPVLSEKVALEYAGYVRWSSYNYLSCCLDAGADNPDRAYTTADVVAKTKGKVSDHTVMRQRALSGEVDAETARMLEDLNRAKTELSALFVGGLSSDEDRALADSLKSEIYGLENLISRKSTEFRHDLELRDLGIDDIMRSLPENSVLVEYIKFSYVTKDWYFKDPRYMAVVVKPGGCRTFDLGEASVIDAAVAAYREHMLGIASSGKLPTIVERLEYDRLAGQLYDLIWRPLHDAIDGSGLALVAPDGAINMVSISGLIDRDGRFLIEDYAIHYLSAGRDLVRLAYDSPPGSGLLALGDPDYDAVDAVSPRQGEDLDVPGDDMVAAMRDLRGSCLSLSDLHASRLPGTGREAEIAADTWKDVTGEPAVLLLGADAGEGAFKEDAPGRRFIHLATHGYFLGEGCEPDSAAPEGTEASELNPLLMSGLLLAGANSYGSGEAALDGEDGVLTAYEVSAMDLRGTDAVVLSACETGLGRVREGEGVYGLRRAFQMAGARTVISALWPVSDEATTELMGHLYKHSDSGLAEAFREMQLGSINS
ncbi:MAG: CHAT domain-containing protein, partial [bacterium]